jgi:flagellar biosynthesis activator protein FlaF
MFQRLYEEVAQDTSHRIRQDEMRAFAHSIDLLQKAKAAGTGTRESVEALFFLSRLWGVLLDDLALPGNGLPEELRAKLISIGIWMLRHAEAIRQGRAHDFQPLIDISQNINAGLRT